MHSLQLSLWAICVAWSSAERLARARAQGHPHRPLRNRRRSEERAAAGSRGPPGQHTRSRRDRPYLSRSLAPTAQRLVVGGRASAMGRELLKANQLRSMSLSEGAGGARKLGSAARRRNIGAVCSSLKASARKKLEGGPQLWIFNRRDHGGLLQITGEPRKAVQYDIGNPLTARTTQHQLPAALCAPLRVVLYENRAGRATFECDRTWSLFGQLGEERATGSRAPIGYQSRARAGQAAS